MDFFHLLQLNLLQYNQTVVRDCGQQSLGWVWCGKRLLFYKKAIVGVLAFLYNKGEGIYFFES